MSRVSIVFRIILTIMLLAVVAGLGVFAYNAGVAQGLAQNVPASAAAPSGNAYVYPYAAMPFYGPFGFHFFGFLGCLVPLFLLCLFFGVLRALIWYGPRHHLHGRHGWGRWGEDGIPPHLEELHQRLHEKQAEKPETK